MGPSTFGLNEGRDTEAQLMGPSALNLNEGHFASTSFCFVYNRGYAILQYVAAQNIKILFRKCRLTGVGNLTGGRKTEPRDQKIKIRLCRHGILYMVGDI